MPRVQVPRKKAKRGTPGIPVSFRAGHQGQGVAVQFDKEPAAIRGPAKPPLDHPAGPLQPCIIMAGRECLPRERVHAVQHEMDVNVLPQA